MIPDTPAQPGLEAAQAWVAAFAEGWQAPASADAFADHFQPWFDPQIRLIQPGLPTTMGHQAFRDRFARPLFALIPDLHRTWNAAPSAPTAPTSSSCAAPSAGAQSHGGSATGQACATR